MSLENVGQELITVNQKLSELIRVDLTHLEALVGSEPVSESKEEGHNGTLLGILEYELRHINIKIDYLINLQLKRGGIIYEYNLKTDTIKQ